MNPVNSNILIGKKDAAFFAANPTLVLLDGQLLYNENTGELFIGDGVTQLNALSPINSGFTPSGTNTQYIAGDGTYINFPTDVSYFNNDAGYLDSGDIGVSVQPYDSNTTLLGNGTAGDEIVLTTGINQLTSLGLNAGESIRRNALNTAYEGFTPFAPSGTSAQYIAGDGTYLTFPTNVSTFTNDSGYLTSTSAGLLYQPLDSDLTSWAGVTRASGFDTFTTTPSSANLRSLVTDETGTGALVFGTSPTFTTSILTPNVTGISGNLVFTNAAQSSGAITNFTFTAANHTTQTASTNIPTVSFTLGTLQRNTGAVTTQQGFLINSPTYSFVGASTITNAYSLFVNAPTAGTNATITNNYAAGFSGGIEVTTGNSLFRGVVTISRGLDANVANFGISSGSANTSVFAINTDQPNSRVLLTARNSNTLNLGTQDAIRMSIDASGNIICGVGAIATNATNGFLYVPTCAGVPTGTPTTVTGRVPIVADSTNNRLYIYSGGAWVALN
jgi:hypothetical protein